MADEKYVVLIFPGMLDNKIIATGPECKQTGPKSRARFGDSGFKRI